VIFERASDIINDHIFLQVKDLVPGSDVFLKIEGLNPAGSIKIKTAVSLIEQAESEGMLVHGKSRIIESSSGNLGIALSMVCSATGYPLTIVTDINASAASIAAMKALGTEVIVVGEPDAHGGFLHGRLGLLRRRLDEDDRLIWLNQYKSPANTRVHKNLTASSIHNELGRIDYLFVGVGTSGTLMGCVDFRRENALTHKIIAVDSIGSVTFGGEGARRFLPGLGASRVPEIFQDDGSFQKLLVSEGDAIACCRDFARQTGMLVGGSTGTVLAGILSLRESIPEGSRVVAISPDLGDKYLSTIYSDDWLISHPSLTSEVVDV
jgi:2,3-diaminopropionate biosynthesis protein SbnA